MRDSLTQGERLGEVFVGAKVQSEHAIVYAIARGQDQDVRLDVPLPEGLQRHHDVIVFSLQGRRESVSQPTFVFDDQDTHDAGILSVNARPDPDFCVRDGPPICVGSTSSKP